MAAAHDPVLRTERGNSVTTVVCVTPKRLQDWVDCCRRLQHYDSGPGHRLLDTVYDAFGQKVLIYVNTENLDKR